mgnify:FL=1|tara:strand:- start:135 stop:899 length:765 start_codon:yes stop_codon:yes gene_type:complete
MHIKKIFNSFSFYLRKIIQKDNGLNPNRSIIIDKATKFVVNECITGDYYEFGVWKGQTFIYAIECLLKTAKKRIIDKNNIGSNPSADSKRKSILENTLFHAFDSFDGLPELTEEDKYSEDFAKGQFKSSQKSLLDFARKSNLPLERIRIHKGWFENTCNFEYFKKNKLKKASIIWLDCDLYSSANSCFQIISYLLQDGTVLIIDDWFSSKGSPFHGVQKAFFEWSKTNDISENWNFTEYQKESWKRISFIANKK